mgnify:CR=1 FL=1
MIELNLPEVVLEFDENGHVMDAHPEDDAFTHRIIEMFMVEANEAVARTFAGLDIPIWLAALEDEVEFQQNPGWRYEQEDRLSKIVPRITMSYDEIMNQLDELSR